MAPLDTSSHFVPPHVCRPVPKSKSTALVNQVGVVTACAGRRAAGGPQRVDERVHLHIVGGAAVATWARARGCAGVRVGDRERGGPAACQHSGTKIRALAHFVCGSPKRHERLAPTCMDCCPPHAHTRTPPPQLGSNCEPSSAPISPMSHCASGAVSVTVGMCTTRMHAQMHNTHTRARARTHTHARAQQKYAHAHGGR